MNSSRKAGIKFTIFFSNTFCPKKKFFVGTLTNFSKKAGVVGNNE